MRTIKLLSLICAFLIAHGLIAQNTAPGYRYASAQYRITSVDLAPCDPGNPTVNTFTTLFMFKFEVDASALITYTGGSVTPATLTAAQLPYALPGAVGVNFGEGSGTDALNGMIMKIENGVAYIDASVTRIYRLCDITSPVINVNFIDGPRTGLPVVGLSGDTDPGTAYDNRDANMELNLKIPVQNIAVLENYESPVSDVGNFTRRVVGRSTTQTIQLQATTDESVSLDHYQVTPTTLSDLFAGGSLEESGISDLAINLTTGLITFTTVGATPGRYPMQICAFDDRGGATTNDFIIELIPPCNTIPTFVPTGTSDNTMPYNLDPDQVTPFTLNIEVASGTTPAGDVLVQTSSLPSGASFLPNNGTPNPNDYIFSWNPDPSDQNVNLTIFATDVDAQGNKLCETAEIRYNLRVNPVPCIETDGSGNIIAPILNAVVVNIDQPAVLPAGYNANEYYPGVSTGIDLVSTVTGRNSTYSYLWEWIGGGTPVVAGNTKDLTDVVPPAGYTGLRITVTDENLDDCQFSLDIPIPIGVPPTLCEALISLYNCLSPCSNHGDPSTFYKGYSKGMELTATHDGTAPFTYLWSTGETSETIFVVPNSATTYTVEVTDINGCVATATYTIDYLDISCGGDCEPRFKPLCNGSNSGCWNSNCASTNCDRVYYKSSWCGGCKINLCKTSSWCGTKTVCVKASWANFFLNWSSYTLGPCASNKTDFVVYDMVNTIEVAPNPSVDGRFVLTFGLMHETDVEIRVIDFMGRDVYHSLGFTSEGWQEEILDLGRYPGGLYIVTISAFDETWTEKLQILK